MDFHILGPLEVRDDRGEISIGGGKQRALLALLLIHPNESLATDRLIDELWGEEPPPTAAKILQNYVSQLRRVLGDDRLQTQARGYALRVGPEELDVDRFRQRFADGRTAQAAGDPERASLLLREALAMWRGPPLADFTYEAFAQHEIGRLEELRLSALIERIDADLALGRHVDLVGGARDACRGAPTAGAAARAAHARPLPLRPSGGGAARLPGRSTDARRGVGDRAWRAVAAPGTVDPALTTRLSSGRPPNGHARRQALGRGRGVGRQCSATSGCSSSSSPRQLSSPCLPPRSSPGAIAPCRGRPSRATRSRSSTPARIESRTRSRVGVAPAALALGNGGLWVANTVDQSVSRIDLASRKVVHAVPVGGVPVSLAVGRSGVWVVRRRSDGFPELIKIDPRFDVVGRGRRVLHGEPWAAASVAAGADAVWVAAEAGSLERLDPGGNAITASVDTENSPTSVAVGAGAVWVGDARGNNVARIDPVTKQVIESITVGDGADAVAVGAGAVWVADRLAGAVVRIDPATNSVTTTIPVGRSPTGIAVGFGSVWVANSRDGTVSRIDPVRDRVVKTIEVGGSPQALAVGNGRVWVSVKTALACPGVRTGDVVCVDSAYSLDSLDPAVANTLPSWTIMYATCAGLFNYPDRPGPAGSRPEPEVAAALPVRSADGKTYTFTIRPGFRFSPPSNAPVTAQTFKFAIERALSPKITLGPARNFAADIVGVDAYEAGKAKHISGVRVARQHPHGPTDGCRRRTSSRGSRCRTSAPSRPVRRSRLEE